jgi:hypothetical protein
MGLLVEMLAVVLKFEGLVELAQGADNITKWLSLTLLYTVQPTVDHYYQ